MKDRRSRRFLSLALLSGLLLGSPVAFSGPVEPVEEASPAEWLRVVEEKNKSVGLEVVIRQYVPADGEGPMVALVGMAHIGEAGFYQAAQEILDDYEVVLYESVKPAGAGGAGGETDEERIESTKAALSFTAGLVEMYRQQRQTLPADMDELASGLEAIDPRLPQFLETATADAWGRAIRYQRHDHGESGPVTYDLMSLGADGKPGGEGADADLLAERPAAGMELAADDGLQGQLASALRLEFQLDELDYAGEGWRCSDMSMDQLSRGLAEHGIDFAPMSDALAGSSFPAQLVKVMLGVLRVADSFVGGAIVDTFKVVMIEMLGDESIMDQSMDMYGEGFAEVIIDQRNQVVIDDLKRLIANEPQVKSIAILYGAAHLPDMAERLGDQLDYVPGEERWLTAIEVDLQESAVTQRDVRQIRSMMKWMLSQQPGFGK